MKTLTLSEYVLLPGIGLTASDFLAAAVNFFGILAAVLLAVWITPKIADRAAQKAQREATFRKLIDYRNNPEAPEYSQAVGTIPIDFRKHTKVVMAWRAYFKAVNQKMDDEQSGLDVQIARITERQNGLIETIALSLGFSALEAQEISANNYDAVGRNAKQRLEHRKVEAIEKIANSLPGESQHSGRS